MLYGNYCYIITENFSQKFSPSSEWKAVLSETTLMSALKYVNLDVCTPGTQEKFGAVSTSTVLLQFFRALGKRSTV